MSKKPISFDGEAAKRVDRIYQTPEVIAQRDFTLGHLALNTGDRVLDVGCGPGLLALQMADIVGPEGSVVGLDPSADMRAIAESRCEDKSWVSIVDGDAVALPGDDGSFDAVVSTQVYEFVPDIEKALGEAHRVLKPGGRLAIIDTDWDSAVVRTNDRVRLHTIMEARRNHFVHSDLPARLPALLTKASFTLDVTSGIPVVNTAMTPGSYSAEVLRSTAKLAVKEDRVSEQEANDWIAELDTFEEQGEFFFSVTRFLFVALKPQ